MLDFTVVIHGLLKYLSPWLNLPSARESGGIKVLITRNQPHILVTCLGGRIHFMHYKLINFAITFAFYYISRSYTLAVQQYFCCFFLRRFIFAVESMICLYFLFIFLVN